MILRDVKNLKELYEKDYLLWIEENLKFIEEGFYDCVDWDNLKEEIKSMGERHVESCISYLAIILEHLYKIDNYKQFTQGGLERGGKGWIKSVKNARYRLNLLYKKYPSLKNKAKDRFDEAWEEAKPLIVESLYNLGVDIEIEELPEKCPYSYEETINREV
ncbi:MAG: DUF29 domain-containing protein [Hydrogenothermaceae bacterium]